MSNNDADIAVIIVNWNGRRFLADCLGSVFRQSLAPSEVVVVDNGSRDGSLEYLQSHWGSRIQLFGQPDNRGFTAGVNTGIRHTRAPWIALLNNDAVAEPRWLEGMLDVARTDPQVGMCAAKILRLEPPGRIDKVGHLLYPDGLNGGRGFDEIDRGQYDRVEEVLFPDGCAALYRRRLFEDVGLFDEQFFAYGDDAELGLRARWAGWRCLYAPEAVVHHHHSGSLGPASPRKAFLVERNRIWLAVKLFPWGLLALNPLYSAWRYLWHLRGALSGQGSAGRFRREHSSWRLAGVLLQAGWAAATGLVPMLKKRRQLASHKRLSSVEFLNLIRKCRISARELALRDR